MHQQQNPRAPHHMKVEGRMLQAIIQMYWSVPLVPKLHGTVGDAIPSTCGVKQGDPLSPLLFGLFIDEFESWLRQRLPNVGVQMGRKLVQMLLYADDMVLLTHNPMELQQMLDVLHQFCSAKGMEVNVRKTEIVVFRKANTPEVPDQWLYNGETVQRSVEFRYLGIILHETKGMSCAIESLATAARKAMWALFPRFKLAGITDISIKLRMFSCLVVPIMEYCSEVWGPDLLFSCDTLDKLWDNELQKIQSIFLRQLGKLRKSVPTTVVHKEMCMNPVAKGWLRASIDLWRRLGKVPSDSLLGMAVRESLASYAGEGVGSAPKSWAGRFMHTVRSLSQGRDADGTIAEFLATNGLAEPDNDKLAAIPWLKVWGTWDTMLQEPWDKVAAYANPRQSVSSNLIKLSTYHSWDGLWYKLWEMGIRGKMFRVLVHLYDSLSRCALHNGESSEYFSSDLGLAEGDPLSPLLYTLFINGLLKEIWEKHPGVPLPKEVDNSGSGEQGIGRADESNIEGRSKLVALMLADDLVGLAESQEELQKMADTIHAYSRKWRFKLSPTKSAVVVFGPLPPNKESPKVSFSSENLPVLDAYTYLGIVFTSDCKWDAHIAGMIEKATASINALQTFFQNRHVSFEVKRAMLLALIRPRVEYSSEVWWASSQQTNTIESKIQIEVLKRSLHCKPNICHEVLRAEAGVRPLSSWLDQRKVEWWFKLQQKDTTSFSRQALEASWPSHRNYTSWQKRFNKLRAELGMQEETLQARVREGHLPSFRAYVRWSIYERDRAVREEGARNKSTLATYMQHYNDDINYFKPQPYLCTGPLSKGMELIMQLRAGILPLNAMTAKFGRQSASRQSARRECCKSCDLGPELGGEVESPEHFLFDCPVYQAQRQKLWEKLTSDPDVAAKCQILDGKSDEEKLHSMLNEEFWGVDVDEESGLVYGPFKHAFKCIAKYVAAAWKIRNAYAHPSDVA